MSLPSGSCRGRELFVWYRVARGHERHARAAVEAMQRMLESQCPGLHARLLTRADDSAAQTWMETYAMLGTGTNGIDDTTQIRIAAAATELRRWLDGDRHVESFDVADRG